MCIYKHIHNIHTHTRTHTHTHTHIQMRQTSEEGQTAEHLLLKPFSEIASVGSGGSSAGSCKGLAPRSSVSHYKSVPSYTKRTSIALSVGGEGVGGGASGGDGGVDFVCYEVTGLVRGSLYEFQIVASNNNVDSSAGSKSFYYSPVSAPHVSPPSNSISVVSQESTSEFGCWVGVGGEGESHIVVGLM